MCDVKVREKFGVGEMQGESRGQIKLGKSRS